MLQRTILVLVLYLASFTVAQKRCYGEDLGCYPAIVRGFGPESLDEMNVSFQLYTTPTADYEIITKDNILTTKFNATIQTVVIAHGYGVSPSYNQPMKDEILNTGTAVNVIMVDAEDALSLGLRAYSNALVVGGQLEQLIRAMRDSAGATFSDFHLIGQSLGAHAVGYAGKKARENGELIGRITGLDPSRRFFQRKSSDVKLDGTDADFVDCIRLDIDGYGIEGSCGTVDYYVNGGVRQPGCSALDDILNFCSHEKFLYTFVESINSNCSFVGYPCSSTEQFDSGLCNDCSPGGCAVMGFHPDGQVGRSGSFYLRTNPDYPFCISGSG